MLLGQLRLEIAAVDPTVDDLDVVELAVDLHGVVTICDTDWQTRFVGVLRKPVDRDELTLDLADVMKHSHSHETPSLGDDSVR